MRACERMLKYVKVHTTSDPECAAAPSSQRQFDLAHMLVEEMKELGIEPTEDEIEEMALKCSRIAPNGLGVVKKLWKEDMAAIYRMALR